MKKKEKVEGFGGSLKLLAKTSFIVFAGVALSKILGYSYRIIIARYFGPEVYGLFTLALMVSGWFIAISALGLSDGLLRFIPIYRGRKEEEKIRHILKFSLGVSALTSLLAGFLLFTLSDFISLTFFHNPSLGIFLRIFSLTVPLAVLAHPFLVSLRAHEEIALYSFIYNIGQNFIKVGTLGLLIVLGFNSNATSISYVAGMGTMLILSYALCKYKIPHIFGKTRLEHNEKEVVNRELVSYSIPLMLFGIISTIFYWIDSFSLGYYRGALEVGLYNAAVPIAVLLGIVPELFMQLFFPLITREYAGKKLKLIEQLSKQVAKWILLVNLPIFAVMIVFPGALLNTFFGGEYLVAEGALRILSIGALLSSIFIVSNQLISMVGKSKLILMNITIASLVNLVLNSILVPMERIGFIENASGLSGAALATLISVAIFNILFMIQSYKYLKIIPVRRKMINLFMAAGLSTGILGYLRTIWASNDLITLGALFSVFLLSYIILVLISGALDENDKEIILAIRNKALFWKKTKN